MRVHHTVSYRAVARWGVLGAFLSACSTTVSGSDDASPGVSGSGGSAGEQNAPAASEVGGSGGDDSHPREESGGGANTDGDSGGGGVVGSGGDGAGGEGAGGDAAGGHGGSGNGGDGSGGGGGCPAFSCCISDVVFAANDLSPLNTCEACKPAESTSDWTATDGEICDEAEDLAVRPDTALYRQETCSTYCNYSELEMHSAVSVSVAIAGSSPYLVSSKKFLELDYEKLAPSEFLNVSSAVLRVHAASDQATGSGTPVLQVRAAGTATPVCSIPIDWNTTPQRVECDVTAAVQGWLASPEGADRKFEVYATGAKLSVSVQTSSATNGEHRPTLLLDYSAVCDGNTCPPLTQ